MAGTGIALYAIAWLLGGEVDNDSIMTFITVAGQIVGAVLTLWGQWRREDVEFFVLKK